MTIKKVINVSSSEQLKIIQNIQQNKKFLELIYTFNNHIIKRIINYSSITKMKLHFSQMPNELTDSIIKTFRREILQ